MISEGSIRVLCFAGGAVTVYAVARIYRNRIRESIASSVTGKVTSSLSTLIPGVPVTITADINTAIARNVSYPVADGVLEGLML